MRELDGSVFCPPLPENPYLFSNQSSNFPCPMLRPDPQINTLFQALLYPRAALVVRNSFAGQWKVL